jgi:intracellular multiplication protein IcmE
LQRAGTVQPEPVIEDTGRAEAVQALSETMSAQMQSILDSRTQPKTVQHKSVTSPDWLDQLNEQEEAEKAAAEAAPAPEGPGQVILVPAGEIYYAQFLTEANSDVPGPVLAQIVSGPLKGSRILGEFKVEEELMTLTFNTVVVDGVSIGIDAIALDPDTTLPAMATDVDHRYLKRIVLPMAAAFVEGMASAIAESGRTTITVTGETVAEETEETTNEQEVSAGVEEAGQELREILDEMADSTEVLVRVEAGTPFGLLFLAPVIQGDEGAPVAQGNGGTMPLAQPVVQSGGKM